MRSTLLLACLFFSFELMAQWTSGTNIYNTNTGNVGVGVNTPLEKLHVNGAIRGNSSAGSLRISTTAGYVDIGPVNSSFSHFYTNMSKYYFDKPVYADGGFSSYSTNDLLLQTSGTTRMTIRSTNGYVGIGTIPSTDLHIKSNTTTTATIESGGTGTRYAQLSFNDNGSILGYVWVVPQSNIMAIGKGSHQHINMRLDNDRVGIGTTSPDGKLHVRGVAYFGNQNEDALHRIAVGGSGGDYGSVGYGYLYTNTSLAYKYSVSDYASQLRFDQGGFTFNTAGNGAMGSPVNFTSAMVIKSNGNVGIGSNPDHKLDVKGIIHAEEVLVDLNVPGPDYVFEPDYELQSLGEIESFIKENKHLPEVPSAKQMEAEGVKIKEMNMLLLKKVEELTLYLIQQQKEIEALKEKVNGSK
jgi:hypothetical protein